jgi:ABC-type branched-subunit amino acid transport system substrate-binding protein
VIHDDIVFAEDFLQGAMDGFVSRGGKIIQRQRTAIHTMDYGPYITKMQNADVVFYWFVSQNSFKFINQYPQYSLKMPLLEGGVRALQPVQLQQLGDKVLGICTVAPYDISINLPEVKNWVRRWNQLFSNKSETEGRNPDNYAGESAYVSVHALLEAIKSTNGDTTPAVFNKALKNLQCDTPWGKLTFNDQGIGIGNIYVLKYVKSGEHYAVSNVYTYPPGIRDEPANVKDIAPKM